MGLDSYLEIFTTMFGWSIANTIVSMLFGTGLVWLPFLFMRVGRDSCEFTPKVA